MPHHKPCFLVKGRSLSWKPQRSGGGREGLWQGTLGFAPHAQSQALGQEHLVQFWGTLWGPHPPTHGLPWQLQQ